MRVRYASGLFSVLVRVILNPELFDQASFMDDKFQDILDSLPEKPPRSRLEPYRQLIAELRQRGRTFREIAHILAEKCHVETAASTIHDFVRVRSRRAQGSATRSSKGTTKSTPVSSPQALETATPAAETGAALDEVRRRISALKVRKSVSKLMQEGFQFDPSEPLRLHKSSKKTVDE